jgi:hypothetical protein
MDACDRKREASALEMPAGGGGGGVGPLPLLPPPHAASTLEANALRVAALRAEIADVFSCGSDATAGAAQSTSIGLILVSPSLVGVPLNLDQTPGVDAVAFIYRSFT